MRIWTPEQIVKNSNITNKDSKLTNRQLLANLVKLQSSENNEILKLDHKQKHCNSLVLPPAKIQLLQWKDVTIQQLTWKQFNQFENLADPRLSFIGKIGEVDEDSIKVM